MIRSLRTSVAFALLAATACGHVDQVSAPNSPPAPSQVAAFAPSSASLTGAVPSPANLRACWSAEGNALDVVSNNLGVLAGTAGYTAAGRFGQAFTFAALGDGVAVAPSATLNIGAGTGVTMAAWVNGAGTLFQPPGSIHGWGPIVEFDFGAHMWQHNQQNSDEGLFGNMALSNAEADYRILQAAHAMPLGGWRHAAVTYDKTTGRMKLYSNGVQVADTLFGAFTPATTTTLRIGARNVGSFIGGQFTFNGAIDEVQLYNRGLSALEIMQLATATGTMCVAPAASFRVEQMPVGSGESGVPFTTQPRVAILDATGAVVSNANNAVTVTVASGTGTLLGTTTVNAVNGIATFTNLAIAGAATTTIRFAAGTLPPAASSVVVSGPLQTIQVARQLGITTQPGGAASGSLLAPQPVVEVRDAAGIRMPGAVNAITASIGSGVGALTGTTTVNAVNAVATFSSLRVNGAGQAAIAFAATGLTGVTSNVFNVTPTPTTLSILTPAAGAESGVPLATQPVIEALNSNGVRDANANPTVWATISSPSGVTLSGTTAVLMVNGVATFTDLKVSGPGSFTLNFSATAYNDVNTAIVPVTQVVRQLAVVSGPASIVSGVVMPTWTVELRDAAGFKVANSTAAVRMGIASGVGVLTGTTEKSAVAGVATFNNIVAAATAPLTFNFSLVTPPSSGAVLVTSGAVSVVANSTPSVPVGMLRHAPKLNSAEVTGSLRVLLGEEVTLNGNSKLTGTLYLPGTPTPRLNGNSTIGVTTDGTGSLSPAGYKITLNGSSSIGTVVRRTDAGTMPVVTAPQAPAGTRNVNLNTTADQVGAWATVRNLTLNGNVGTVTVPAGAYGEITVNGTSNIAIGVAGATTPAVYHFQKLRLNGTSALKVLGPVVVTVGGDVTLNGSVGATGNPEWLTLKIFQGGLTLNGGVTAAGIVIAPSGGVIINGNSSLTGGLAADALTLNGNSLLRITKSLPTP